MNIILAEILIVIALLFLGDTAKEMWKNLIDGNRAAKKRKEKRSGAAAGNEKPWKFEAQMEFLNDFHQNDIPTHSNISQIDIENVPVIINSDDDNYDSDSDDNTRYELMKLRQ